MDSPHPPEGDTGKYWAGICGVGMILWCCHLMYTEGYKHGYEAGQADYRVTMLIDPVEAQPLPQNEK